MYLIRVSKKSLHRLWCGDFFTDIPEGEVICKIIQNSLCPLSANKLWEGFRYNIVDERVMPVVGSADNFRYVQNERE